MDIEVKGTLRELLDNGTWDKDVRPKYEDGSKANSLFITRVGQEYDLSNNSFTLPRMYHTPWKSAIREIRWIYQKQSNRLEDAHKLGITWWDPWDTGDGTIGKRYGWVVSKYNLIYKLLSNLKVNPYSRRHMIDLHDNSTIEGPGLHACAFLTMWSVREVEGQRYLDMTLVQRSSDFLVAGAINKLQYAVLLMMVAHSLGYKPGFMDHFVQNLHIYCRHVDTAKELVNSKASLTGPEVRMKKDVKRKSFFDYTEDDFELVGPTGLRKLNLEVAV